MMDQPKRLNMALSPKVAQAMEEIAERIDATTKHEVIRRALFFYLDRLKKGEADEPGTT